MSKKAMPVGLLLLKDGINIDEATLVAELKSSRRRWAH